VVTRRALLGAGAGAAAALAGCGERTPAAPPEADVLARLLAADLAAVAAYRGVRGAGALERAARARVDALRSAGARRPVAAAGPAGVQAALAAERAGLAAYVQALPDLRGAALRRLGAAGVAATATSEAELLERLGRDPSPAAFPGEPA